MVSACSGDRRSAVGEKAVHDRGLVGPGRSCNATALAGDWDRDDRREGAMTYEQLIVEEDGAVATVRLNNPSRLNALSPVMTPELMQALLRLANDDAIRAIVLTGEGRGFSAGADLSALQEPYMRGERPQLSLFLKEGYNKLIPLLAVSGIDTLKQAREASQRTYHARIRY